MLNPVRNSERGVINRTSAVDFIGTLVGMARGAYALASDF